MPKINFMREFVKLYDNTEIPGLFACWCGLAGLSCAIGRKLWIDMDIFNVFPNLFVVLVASSGRCRKSSAIGVIESILNQLEPRPNIVAQKLTQEGLIDTLRVVQTNDESHFLRETCVGFAIVDELSTFINRNAIEHDLDALLIQLFDCKSSFVYRTRGRGAETITNGCLGLLGGTTIDTIRRCLSEEAITGGLVSRIIFVYNTQIPSPVARPISTDEKKEVRGIVIKELQRIQTYEGVVSLTPEAWKKYEEIYNEFYTNTPYKMYDNPYLSGYASRRNVHLLKVAMLLAVSKGSPFLVDVEEVTGAEKLLSMSEGFMPMLMNFITSSEVGRLTYQVLDVIRTDPGITRIKLLNQFIHKADYNKISDVLQTLVHGGLIKPVSTGSDIILSPTTG